MFAADVALALSIALVCGFIILALTGWSMPERRRPGELDRWPRSMRFILPFSILLLAIWAGGLWLIPLGPQIWGRALVPLVVTGLLVALLLGAFAPVWIRDGANETIAGGVQVAWPITTIFAWVLLLALLVVIVAGYALGL